MNWNMRAWWCNVIAQTTTNTLVEWAVDEPGGYCQTSTTEQIGFTYAPPVAVSWGDSRVDLFGATSAGDLVHFWSSDGANYQDQTTFSIGGSNVALPVARSHDSLAVTSTENGSLDLFYFTGARIDRLFWRGGTGWSNVVAGPLETQAIVAASVLPIDDSYDPDGAFYASPAQGAGSILVESTGVEENFDSAVPAEALTELSSATLEAAGVHVVFGVGGGTLYWTATGDGT